VRGSGLEGFWQRAGGDQCRFVDEAFAAVAKDYDRLVRLFSCGLDRGWRRSCVEACNVARGGWILDCATGTGWLALAAAEQAGVTGRVLGLDPCGPMLAQARRKASRIEARLAWVQARVEQLPLRSETISNLTLGLGLRHMEIKVAAGEMARVLVPGGHLVLLEFLRPPSGVAPRLALTYLRWVVPPLAALIAWSRMAWTLAAYLPRTIEAAPSVPDLVEALDSAGLYLLFVKSLFADIVWLVVAMKPPRRLGETVKR